MPYRRRPKTTEKKPRVRWSEAERQVIIDRALKLQAERPDLAGLPLLREAQYALPVDRRRHIIATHQVKWFEPGLIAARKARNASPPTSIELEDWKERSLKFSEMEYRLLGAVNDKTERLAKSIDALAEQLRATHEFQQSWFEQHVRIEGIFANVLGELRVQTELFGHLFPDGSGGPPPSTDDARHNGSGRPSPEKGKPTPTRPTRNGQTPRMAKLRIAIVGPDSQQFHRIGQQIGRRCTLFHLDREHLKGALPACDWFILTPPCSRQWRQKAPAGVDRSRVIHLATGGVGEIVATIDKIARGTIAGQIGSATG